MYERNYHKEVLKQKGTEKEKTNKRFSWKKALAVFLIVGFLVGMFFLLRAPRLQVGSFNISGTEVLDNEDIKINLEKKLEGKWLWFFPRTSTFLIDTGKLENNLKKEFSRIEQVVIKRDGLRGLSVEVKEYGASYLWCTKDDDCYFMDKNAVVYNSAPIFSGSAYVKIVSESPVEPLPFKAFTEKQISQIADLQKGLLGINIDPIAFVLLSDKKIEIDFLHNKSVAKIILDPSIETETSLGYLFSALRTQDFSNLFTNENKKLLYIDLRFSNKVIYKFAEDEQ
jgi:cell division septal protein FtsQ